ncbi:KH domain-containing protein [Candidatus Vidania fulgoroideorum]
MGNKVSPISFRLLRTNNWILKQNYFNYKKNFLIFENLKKILNYYLKDKIDKFYVEIFNKFLIVNLYTNKPGLIIGKNGLNIETIKKIVEKKICIKVYFLVRETFLYLDDTSYLLNNIIYRIKNFKNYKIFINNYFEKIKKNVIGAKIIISGRINGSDIARKEKYYFGNISLQSIKVNLFYKSKRILTKYGIIGCKIFLFYDFFKRKKI